MSQANTPIDTQDLTQTFLTDKTLPDTPVKPAGGEFAIYGDSITWIRCREQFAQHFNSRTPAMFFATYQFDVVDFVIKFEKICMLNCQKFEHTKFAKTNRNYAIYIEPSQFWMECEARRSLFTIVLRAGLNYSAKADNFEDSFRKCDLSYRTWTAIKRFLFGFVNFIPDDLAFGPPAVCRIGWYSIFQDKDVNRIKKQLVSVNNIAQNNFDRDAIWS